MIRIERPPEPPKILKINGRRKTKRNCDRYDRYANDYRDGSRKFEFDSAVYGHKSVKEALLRAQFEKCCYCESRFRATSYGAVEHFRPKGAVQQDPHQGRGYPGYYWLAYDWDNLLVSCDKCNTTHKRDLFPLADDTARARSHHDDVNGERPLFVDPAREDPRPHIRFRGAAVVSVTQWGRATIKGTGLRRSNLEEARMERLDHLELLCRIVELEGRVPIEQVEGARGELAEAILPSAKYSAMAQDFLDPNAE